VILGGGVGALTAAWAITSTPNWRNRFEISIYQEGWLLGGKGASVRGEHDRIEEHGLHIWMGFYHSAFRVMREVYDSLGRPQDAPQATWREAFAKHGTISLTERIDEEWRIWHLEGLTDDGEPGEGPPPSPADYVRRAVELASSLFGQWVRDSARDSAPPRGAAAMRVLPRLERLFALASRAALAGSFPRVARLLRDAARMSRSVLRTVLDEDTARRLFICLDLAATSLAGAIDDGLTAPGADHTVIDDWEFRDWLRHHGASEETIDSALIRGFYNLAFSHHAGAGAGTAIIGIMRMCLGWRGAIYYKMTAGMGETVFAPLYLALRRRGVRFAFFHRVRELGVSADGRRVDRIELGRQATVLGRVYEPLIDVKGLPCWPPAPRYEQLEEGEALRAHGHRFASLRDDWPDRERLTLREGEDFDRIILGISHGSLASITGPLAARSPDWRAMLDGVRTTGTLATQLWFRRDLRGLGWTRSPPVLGAYAQPFDTWADLSHLLPLESWPRDADVRHVAYLCGALDEPLGRPLPHEEAQRAAWQRSVTWLRDHGAGLFTGCALPNGAFDWGTLHDPEGRSGEARLRAQYLRANSEGSDRYVLCAAGTTRHRLPADESGFDNLLLAGDWTRTGLDAGCVEAATMSGLQAGRAVIGEPIRIPGEAPLFRSRRYQGNAGWTLPRYVDRPDEVALRSPYVMTGVKLRAWPVRADRGAAQRLVDRYLNHTSDGALDVRVIGNRVFVVAAFLGSVQSGDPSHRQRGAMSESDVGVWVPVSWRHGSRRRQGWYLPWIFVDNTPATTSGREVFGFPKSAGIFDVRHDSNGLAELAIRCPVMPERGAQAYGAVDTVLHAARLGYDQRSRVVQLPGRRWLPDRVPMIFLKQFRDIASTEHACYQAVVSCESQPTAVRAWGIDLSPWRLTWTAAESHPVAAELGMPRSLELSRSLTAEFDFEIGAGSVLFERGADGRAAPNA
jgi:uncharacterized protein with NAD-binding domain and iron-sulfur cluster